MLNLHEKKAVLKRLTFIEGQIHGIRKMIEGDRSLSDIFTQLKAAEQALHAATYGVLEEQLKMHLAEELSKRLATCPGNCSDAERLQFTKKEFARLDLKEVIQSLAWLSPGELDSSPTKIDKRDDENKKERC